jgi:hypothetical protein
MTARKTAGAPYPTCSALCPAEYAQIDRPARWTCNSCGADGELTGSLTIRPEPKPKAVPAKRYGPKGLTRQFPAPESLRLVSSLGADLGPPA